MNMPNKNLHLALASALVAGALGFIGCGTSDPGRASGGGGGDVPDIATPVTGGLPEPPAQYSPFRPATEDELLARYREGDNEGKPVANYGYMIARTKPDFDPAAFAKHGADVVSSFTANGSRYFYLHKESGLVETMRKMTKLGGLMYVEPDVLSYTTAGFTANDPYLADTSANFQYGAKTTQVMKAWQEFGFGPHRPVVVDIDTGLRWNHNEFTDGGKNIIRHAWSWYGTTAGTSSNPQLLTTLGGLDPLNDPTPPDYFATNPTMGGGSGTDQTSGHGTHTAGTIAAVGNNNALVAGMCWQVDLVSYKGLSDAGSGGNWAVYGSLWHLAKWKNQMVDVLDDNGEVVGQAKRHPYAIPANFSLGGGQMTQFQADMVEMALENDIIMCCSSGNDGSGFQSWPGGLPGTIRIGSVNYQDRRTNTSSWGPNLSVMAPGVNVISLGRASNTATAFNSGTSMSAPHVTGLVGYMLTFNPDLKPDQIKTYLERNADPIDGQVGYDPHTGWGRINAYRTIKAVIDDMGAGATPPSDYMLSPVKLTVKDGSGTPVNDAIVTLYNCNAAGTITNYTNVNRTGASWLDVRNDSTLPPEDGVARFGLLRPGYYRMVASYAAYDWEEDEDVMAAASTPVFEVRAGGTVAPMTLALDLPELLFIQTMATSNGARANGDTCIAIYDTLAGAAVIDYDAGAYDEIAIVKPRTEGRYWLRIYPYNSSYYGEYALWVGGTSKTVAPGRYSEPGPDGVQSTHAASRATAQEIALDDKMVYADMTNTTGHYYTFTIGDVDD